MYLSRSSSTMTSSPPNYTSPVLDCSSHPSLIFTPSPPPSHPLKSPTLSSIPPTLLPHLTTATSHLKSSHLVSFPTETVYGLGASTSSPQAISRVYTLKGRPQDNPLIIHISSLEMLQTLLPQTYTLSPLYLSLITHFWPGPLTLLFPNPNPPQLPAPQTLAIRMPSHPLARALIHYSNLPISAPSANSSGRPSPTTAQHVFKDLGSKLTSDGERGVLGCILDGGAEGCQVGVESTVVDGLAWEEEGVVKVLRPGGVGVEEIERVVREVENKVWEAEGRDIRGKTKVVVHGKSTTSESESEKSFLDSTNTSPNGRTTSTSISVSGTITPPTTSQPHHPTQPISNPSTPGMKYKHYSPSIPVFLLLPSNTFPHQNGASSSSSSSSASPSFTSSFEKSSGVRQRHLPREVLDRIAGYLSDPEEDEKALVNGNSKTKVKSQKKITFGLMHFTSSPLSAQLKVNPHHASTIERGMDSQWGIKFLDMGVTREDAARSLFKGMLKLEGQGQRETETPGGVHDDDLKDGEFVEGEDEGGGGVDAILIEGCSDEGIGLAFMERAGKAVGGGGRSGGLDSTNAGVGGGAKKDSIGNGRIWVDVNVN